MSKPTSITSIDQTPMERAAHQRPYIRDHWMRFNTLPAEIQEVILDLIYALPDFGIRSIQATVKLKKLKAMSDKDIVSAFADRPTAN